MILWLTGRSGVPPTTKGLLIAALKTQGINSTDILFNSLHIKVPSLGEYPSKKVPAEYLVKAAQQALSNDCKILRPNLIVVNDEGTLRALTREPYTLAQVRGSVYDFEGIPVLIFDQFKSLWSTPHGKFVFGLDLQKLVRYAKGKQKNEPAFNFHVVKTLEEVQLHCARAKQSSMVSMDVETFHGYISCVSFSYDWDNSLQTFCVPFFEPWNDDGCYWNSQSLEIEVRKELKALQASPVYKIMQNGMYDCAYFIEEGMPPVNYLLDTQNMMHAMWCEAPKKLHNIASYFLDCYRYWKDENKGVKEDGFGRSHRDVERYWRYNGLDTYYTWLACRELLNRMVQLPWALRNYDTTISLANGPCLAASLRGLNVDKKRHAQVMAEKLVEANEGLADVRRMVGDADFNPRSPQDVAWFLYDVLGAKTTRLQKRKNSKYGPRSTDEKVLKLVKEQGNVIINNFIDRILKAKQPAAVISKYGDLRQLCRNGRFLSWLNATATTTGRFNSGSGQFWTGTNAQNIPAALREYYTSDNDYVFLELDYSASDDRFIAYEVEDPDKIETVEDKTKDIHCKHCAQFFSKSYDEIYAGWKADEDWVIKEPTGVRQITKKVTHGRNYGEGASTMYNLMGRDAVVATAVALGHAKALKYTEKELIGICAILIDKYDHPHKGMYKRLRPWSDEICKLAVSKGNTATASGFTRKFFGDLTNDHKAKRELASFYGQGGTAGNVNRALKRIYYSGIDDGRTCLFLLQVHDSLLFAVHKNSIAKVVPQIREIMEQPVTIHGRSFIVPVDPKVGLTWSKKMLGWKPSTTYQDIVDFEAKVFGKKYNKDVSIDQMIANIAAMTMELGEIDTRDLPELGQEDDDAQMGENLICV